MGNTYDEKLICIGSGIRRLRNKKKMSQEELAYLIGLSVITISRIESGQNAMNIQTLMKLSEALEVSLEEILCGEESAVR